MSKAVEGFRGDYEAIAALDKAGRLADAVRHCQSLLKRAPEALPAYTLLANLFLRAEDKEGAVAAMQALVARAPGNHEAHSDAATLFYSLDRLVEAERHVRQAMALNSFNPQAHNLLAQIMARNYLFEEAVFHYRQVLLLHEPLSPICSNMGNALVRLGELDEAADVFEMGHQIDPEDFELLLGWARMEEARRNLPRAWELLEKAETISPDEAVVLNIRARLHFRAKEFAQAEAVLLRYIKLHGEPDKDYEFYFIFADVLDGLGRFDEAMAKLHIGNKKIHDQERYYYQRQAQSDLVARMKRSFPGLIASPPPTPREEAWQAVMPAPIFIVGFPRSGTTLVEQILASHPGISAGDELTYMSRSTKISGHLLGNGKPYPDSFAGLDAVASRAALEKFRAYYIQNVRSRRIVQPGTRQFTDKMPLNEMHLGLMRLVFPDAPIIHVVRHPLDVVLSCYFNELTHGGNCAFGLDTAAQHYALIYDLLKHYKDVVGVPVHTLRYESLVAEPRPHAESLLAAVNEPWDDRCLEFHNNNRYARTASYAQVSEKLYSRSAFRYRNYLRHLQPAVDILAPIIEELGYEV